MGTGRVPGTCGHRNDAQENMGTRRVLKDSPGSYSTGKLPGTNGYRKDARAHIVTGIVPGHIWAAERL